MHQEVLKLTKFISNSRRALETIPVEDHAKSLKDLDLKFDSLPTRRALGMLWNVENDTLEFTITLVEKLLTHRGILATVIIISYYYYLVDIYSHEFVVREKTGMNLSQMK